LSNVQIELLLKVVITQMVKLVLIPPQFVDL
jgi:hypothetical protein